MLLFIVITVNECCTSSPVHAHNQTDTVMVLLTVLWAMTVWPYYYFGKMHSMLILYRKLLFPFHVPHGIQTKYIVCATSDPPKYQIIKHLFAEDNWSPFCSTVCTYMHVAIV
jgi:hypothetical protein